MSTFMMICAILSAFFGLFFNWLLFPAAAVFLFFSWVAARLSPGQPSGGKVIADGCATGIFRGLGMLAVCALITLAVILLT